MEPLWSSVVATGSKQWQPGSVQKRRKQAKTVALYCDRSPIGAHGKEGVDGSSPSGGFEKLLQIRASSRSTVAATGDGGRTCPRFSAKLRSAASEHPCRCGSCATLSIPTRSRGKEGVAGRRDSDTRQTPAHSATRPPATAERSIRRLVVWGRFSVDV